jgi:mRNA interferase HicA
MKYSELHRKIIRNGWTLLRVKGSHYIYTKNGKNYTTPYHGAKEIGEGLRKQIIKEMELTK